MPLKSLFAYSFQSFYLAGSFLLLFIFLPSFYNLSVGFALSTVGMIILISRVFDVFSDFIIGFLTERRFIKGLPKKNQILLGIFVFIFSFCLMNSRSNKAISKLARLHLQIISRNLKNVDQNFICRRSTYFGVC